MTFRLESLAFKEGARIPDRYTCDGEGISPPLNWSELPPLTQSLVLMVEDPDLPFGLTYTHWIVYNIPAERVDLPEGVPQAPLWEGMCQGRRVEGKYGYLGPCPQGRKTHRYYFRLFALRSSLDLEPGSARREVLRRMSGRIIASAELMGTYGPRNKRKR